MNAMIPLFYMLYWIGSILCFTVKPKPVLKKGFVAPEVAIPLTDQIITPDQKSVVLECKFSSKCHKYCHSGSLQSEIYLSVPS